MKTIRLLLLLMVLGGVAAKTCAADATGEKAPELRGVLADGAGKRFGLFIPASGQTDWAKVGQTVGGWKLKEYRAADDTLVLVKDGREEILHMSESVVAAPHKGSLADAEALLTAMKFDERMNKGLLKNTTHMLKQLLVKNGLANPTPEQLAEFQKKIASIFDPAQLKARMAEAMGGVYTQEELKAQTDFYATDAGQAALDKLGPGGRTKDGSEPVPLQEFYATPIGQSVKAKQAQLNTQMQKTVGPWIGGVMGEAQKAAAEFVKAQGVDSESAVSVAPATAAPTP